MSGEYRTKRRNKRRHENPPPPKEYDRDEDDHIADEFSDDAHDYRQDKGIHGGNYNRNGGFAQLRDTDSDVLPPSQSTPRMSKDYDEDDERQRFMQAEDSQDF